jgi:hypothetical protein
MKIACLLALGAIAAGSVGCTADVSDLFGDDAAGGSGGSRGNGSPTTGTESTTVTNGPGSSTTGPGGQTTTQSSVTNGPGGQTTTVTTGNPALPSLYCNNQPCNGGEVCCYYLYEAGQDYCGSPGSCPGNNEGWIEIGCNGDDDCPGQECCGTFDGQSWIDVSCQNACNGNGQTEMCGDDPSSCSSGECSPSQLLGDGYNYCGE